ncbi:MAG: hypothetical protein ACOYM3_30720 [Terrimicrobiaceae bacterium]
MVARRRNLFLILLLALGALVFLDRSMVNGREANTIISKTDQGAYIKYGINLRESDFSFVGTRNRMPAYPALLALFMEKGETPDGFFQRGKLINTGLTLAGLVFIGLVFLRSFPTHHGLNLLFLTAFTVFAFRAAYVQAEILYYLLTFAVFLLCWSFFRKPRLLAAVLAGGLCGLAHLTKASVLPGLLVFVVFYPLDLLWQMARGHPPLRVRPWTRLAVTVLVALTFLAAIFPYLSKSKEIYGRYFYNVNSTFYMWCDSWRDAKSRTKAAGDRFGWPDMPEDQIPSLKNYVRTHSPGQIFQRLMTGVSRVFYAMEGSYGYLWLCLAYLAFALWVAFCKRLVIGRLVWRRPGPVLALLAYFVGYYMLFAWYSQIIQGNRFALGIFLPFLFTISVFLCTFARRVRLRTSQGFVPALPAFNVMISAWLAVEIALNCLFRLPSIYGGN